MKTVADRVGVSVMTVSNAFSRPDQLSSAMRERILAAAGELGYAGPDPAARALARGSSGTVGILLTDSVAEAFTDEMSTAFLAAVAEALRSTGLGLTLLPSSTDEAAGVVPARDVAMDGAVVYSCRTGSMSLQWLARRGLPLVHVDRDAEPGVASINLDDRGGAQAAAQHLVDLGHRHVGLVLVASGLGPDGTIETGPAHEGFAARERRLGWIDVLEAAGARHTTVHRAGTTHEDGHAAGRELLGSAARPTAVLCFSDAIAAGVIRAAEDLDLAVPADVSVVGFDDVPLARRVRPPLTTVAQDVEAKGRAAVAALVAAVERARARPASDLPSSDLPSSDDPPSDLLTAAPHIVLPCHLVVRDSTGPPTG